VSASPDPAAFQEAFGDLRSLILEEWPELDADELDTTEGALDRVVVLVAGVSGRTKAMSRRLLAELVEVSALDAAPRPTPAPPRRPAPPPARPMARAARTEPSVSEPVESLVTSLEAHLEALTREVKRDVAPLAADTAREHLGLVLLLTAGIAFAVGLFLGALGYPRDEEKASTDEEEAADDDA
jgi:hypothetical protein